MKYMYKAALITAFLSMVFSGYAAAGEPEDYCDSDGCILEDGQAGTTLDFGGSGINLGSHFHIDNSSVDDLVIKNLSISDNNIEFDRDDDTDDYNDSLLHGGSSPGGLRFESWNIDTTERVTSLFYMNNYYMNSEMTSDLLSLNNSSIRANADTIFHTITYFPELLDAGTVNALSVNNSIIINDKQHISDNNGEIEQAILNTRLGSILNVYPISDWADWEQRDLTVGYNFNQSFLSSEALAGINQGGGCCSHSGAEDSGNTIAINLTDSEGQFDNLLINGSTDRYDVKAINDAVQVNLDNSTVSSGIYSEYYGSFRLTNTSLNLSNSSVFNYQGDCSASGNCNSYLIEDDCYSCGSNVNPLSENPHYYDSYIHEINISGNSNFVFFASGRI
ncbi:hypothetical protein [Budvicia aquatica]|uniref:Adhesin n=1 Tax=Budvicia aquatica TaxID=82979 RepID=A0A484ZC30_9GAMM|nr:hypothetical protein [Budvicia aquatica]VFS45944.1 Uncharacterised protein [Budvicia aquatica]